jgi:CheY-like chemotaxis protein
MHAAHPLPPFRVLYVDDNRDVADSAVLLLTTVGFEAQACYGGVAALELNESFRPSVCFVDLNMPGMSGYEFAERIQSAEGWKPLLLVAVTALSDPASRARTEAAGFGLHLVKPVDPEKLLTVVNCLFNVSTAQPAHAAARE